MKIKRAINYLWVILGAALLFTSSYLEVPEIALAVGFSFLMIGIYKLSKKTGESLESLKKRNYDEKL